MGVFGMLASLTFLQTCSATLGKLRDNKTTGARYLVDFIVVITNLCVH